jgi:hypothetical protein
MKALFKDVGFSDRVFHVIGNVIIPDACIQGLHITQETCRVFEQDCLPQITPESLDVKANPDT